MRLKRDFHSFACELGIRKSPLTKFFHVEEEFIVVFGIVVGHGELFHAGHFRYLHGLVKAAVPPSPIRSVIPRPCIGRRGRASRRRGSTRPRAA